MNPDREDRLAEPSGRSPFWVCFTVFLLLAGDYGFRFVGLLEQRQQLTRASRLQAQNAGALTQARQMEARLEALSLDLLQIAKTNAAARSIVEEFNIQWDPRPAAAVPAPPLGSQKK